MERLSMSCIYMFDITKQNKTEIDCFNLATHLHFTVLEVK